MKLLFAILNAYDLVIREVVFNLAAIWVHRIFLNTASIINKLFLAPVNAGRGVLVVFINATKQYELFTIWVQIETSIP